MTRLVDHLPEGAPGGNEFFPSGGPFGEFFRHEYGALVAVLSRRVGIAHLDAVEDAVQVAFLKAVERWRVTRPDDPSAWLYRVAHNHLMGTFRTTSRHRRLEGTIGVSVVDADDGDAGVVDVAFDGEVKDDLLRMLFVCCDDDLPVESQLVFALKTLCGFSVDEIAARLFISEANVYKRLSRARAHLKMSPLDLGDDDAFGADMITARRPAVLHTLYMMFTEGYLSSGADVAIRRELCAEALRLALLLVNDDDGDGDDNDDDDPRACALVALMHFQAARLDARVDDDGGLVLLEAQDRGLYDARLIEIGLRFLARSARGDVYSRYHAEAGIAAEHCLSTSFSTTRWDKIVDGYALLEAQGPSPLHTLNRAVAMAEWRGPRAGLEVLEGMVPPSWLLGSWMWSAVLADLHRRAGDRERAKVHAEMALSTSPSSVRCVLRRRLGAEAPSARGRRS